jgi:hypothetical protein
MPGTLKQKDILAGLRSMPRGASATICGIAVRRMVRGSGWISVEGRKAEAVSEAADRIFKMIAGR